MKRSTFSATLVLSLTVAGSAVAREHDASTPAPRRSAWGRESAIELVARATRAEAHGDPYGALRSYAEAIRLDPTYGSAQLAYGRLRERLHDFGEAEYLYGLAARSGEAAAEAFAARAALRKRVGRTAEALMDLERAAALSVELGHVETLSAWYAEQGAWPAALAVFRRLAASMPVAATAEVERAVHLRVQALTVLAAECDPVAGGRGDESWVRRALARIAQRGTPGL